MFPDITRDEVFRLETRRFWLRWPVPADAELIARAQADSAEPAGFCVLLPEAARRLVDQWRADNEAGRALHLTVVSKAAGREPVGWVRIGRDCDGEASLFVAVARDTAYPDVAVEAAEVMLAMAALLGAPSPISLRSLSGETRRTLRDLAVGQAGRRRGPTLRPGPGVLPRTVLGCCLA